MKIQLTDQWSLNEVSKVLHNMIGIAQRIILAYHLQSNGLCKWQNRTIKDSLVKVLNENSCDWSIIIEGVLLSHRVNKHTSTNFSPFFFLYNKEPALPIDVKYDLVYIEGNESEHPSSKIMFDSLLTTAQLRSPWEQSYIKQLMKIFVRYRNWLHQIPSKINVGQKVLLKSQRRMERKCGEFSFNWFGPFRVHSISN